MTDNDLLDTVAVHVNWLRRDDPLTNRVDSLQSADYLERLAAALRARDTEMEELAQQVNHHSGRAADLAAALRARDTQLAAARTKIEELRLALALIDTRYPGINMNEIRRTAMASVSPPASREDT